MAFNEEIKQERRDDSIYTEGYEAARIGGNEEYKNPYPKDSEKYEAYLEGYNDFKKNINEKILKKKEEMISNCAFQRFAGGFEIYQKLINDSKDRDLIVNRMHELYQPMIDNINKNQNETNKPLTTALTKLLLSTLAECENKKFDRNNFAEKISMPPLYDICSAEWNHEAGDVEKNSGMNYVNEMIAYKKEENNTISLHLMPSNVESKDVAEKRREGYGVIARKIKSEEIQAERIIMKSWLYDSEFEDKTKKFFGDDVTIEDVSPDDELIKPIQFLGLQYNNRMLKKYLETGKKPDVRQIIMTSQKFTQKF